MSEQVRAGTLQAGQHEAESCMPPQHGHCMTMGTGLHHGVHGRGPGHRPAGQRGHPAVDGRRNVLARNAGRRIVEMVHTDQTISKVLAVKRSRTPSARWRPLAAAPMP